MTSGTNPTPVQYLALDRTHDTHYHVQREETDTSQLTHHMRQLNQTLQRIDDRMEELVNQQTWCHKALCCLFCPILGPLFYEVVVQKDRGSGI